MSAPSDSIAPRPTRVDYDRIQSLCYVGSYQRRIPVSITRMIENAYDWEHLPFVHSSTFSDIKLIESGDWGWRADLGSANTGGKDRSQIELLVDSEKNYWATTVVTGKGRGVEIHTQATALGDQEIDIEVRFYLPRSSNWVYRKLVHWTLKRQYHQLYEEDEALMQGRQRAVDQNKRWKQNLEKPQTRVRVAQLSELDKEQGKTVETSHGRFRIVYREDEWRAYSTTCPHQLGDLEEATVSEDGTITCPWHGYRFSIESGANLDGKCKNLQIPSVVIDEMQTLFLELDVQLKDRGKIHTRI
ncbi:MAG: Rieske (2Fe-2S) protein [Pseudomonadota bacterium]